MMDTFLAAVGSATDPGRFLSKAVLDYYGLREKELDEFLRAVVGDLGGAVIPKQGREEDKSLEEFNEHWMGISLEHVRSCARRSATDGTPGVIGVACGREKVDIVKACMREEIVNEFFIDDDLANALIDN
jgi:DNA-binding transcriptional regulator LsrR (DeoR family)